MLEDVESSKKDLFKCRRIHAWEDFISYTKKPWTNVENLLCVNFFNEVAIDTGGPKREFYQGMCKNY